MRYGQVGWWTRRKPKTFPNAQAEGWETRRKNMNNVTEIDVGNHVECDLCCKDFTNLDTPGGFLFSSKGVGPCCAEKFEADVRRFKEEDAITDRCPPGMAFRDWILNLRGGDNKIRVYGGGA